MGEPLTGDELQCWLNEASNFRMNSDFEVQGMKDVAKHDLMGVMNAMKVASEGKMTIQALGDKIILSRIMDNLDVPQMALLLAVQDPGEVRQQVELFVDSHLLQQDAPDVILKPTHLSNGEGVAFQQRITPDLRDATVEFIELHVQKFLAKRASEFESLALQSLSPGFIAQAKYQSSVAFGLPLELRVTALWGRVRVGVWWWGDLAPQRNAWVVRRPHTPGEFSDLDDWEALHEHDGENPGFEAALSLFQMHMPKMVATTEHMANAVGAPFLRADFFVGNVEFGVRLNEVAYGSGVEYRRRDGGVHYNDAAAIAQILQEGTEVCHSHLPAEVFLKRLGLHGEAYGEASVQPLPIPQRVPLPPGALRAEKDHHSAQAVPPDQCETPLHHHHNPTEEDFAALSPRRALSCVGGGWLLDALPGCLATRLGSLEEGWQSKWCGTELRRIVSVRVGLPSTGV